MKLGTNGRWVGTGARVTPKLKLFWSQPMAPWTSAAAHEYVKIIENGCYYCQIHSYRVAEMNNDISIGMLALKYKWRREYHYK